MMIALRFMRICLFTVIKNMKMSAKMVDAAAK
jgi:hypothetical protein